VQHPAATGNPKNARSQGLTLCYSALRMAPPATRQLTKLAKQLIEERHSVSEHLKQLGADLRQSKPHQETESDTRKRATNVWYFGLCRVGTWEDTDESNRVRCGIIDRRNTDPASAHTHSEPQIYMIFLITCTLAKMR
jgi:hypothetical protein